MMHYMEGIEFERKNFFGMFEEILNNPAQQYKYFHICIKSINICVTVRTGSSIPEISICTKKHIWICYNKNTDRNSF